MTRTIYKLENWSVGCEPDSYLPPEMQTQFLCGEVYNHPKYPNGHRIKTSCIVDVLEDLVWTRNSLYRLGVAAENYVQWCKDNHKHIPTEGEPIKMKE